MMLAVVIAVLLVIVLIFGVSSGMQSYATAQQAQATIEVAQLGQINAWGNLVTILTIALALVIFVALAAAVLWILYRRSGQRSAVSGQRSTLNRPRAEQLPGPAAPSLETLIQLETLRMLRSMTPTSPPPPLLQEKGDESPGDEPLQWLR